MIGDKSSDNKAIIEQLERLVINMERGQETHGGSSERLMTIDTDDLGSQSDGNSTFEDSVLNSNRGGFLSKLK